MSEGSESVRDAGYTGPIDQARNRALFDEMLKQMQAYGAQQEQRQQWQSQFMPSLLEGLFGLANSRLGEGRPQVHAPGVFEPQLQDRRYQMAAPDFSMPVQQDEEPPPVEEPPPRQLDPAPNMSNLPGQHVPIHEDDGITIPPVGLPLGEKYGLMSVLSDLFRSVLPGGPANQPNPYENYGGWLNQFGPDPDATGHEGWRPQDETGYEDWEPGDTATTDVGQTLEDFQRMLEQFLPRESWSPYSPDAINFPGGWKDAVQHTGTTIRADRPPLGEGNLGDPAGRTEPTSLPPDIPSGTGSQGPGRGLELSEIEALMGRDFSEVFGADILGGAPVLNPAPVRGAAGSEATFEFMSMPGVAAMSPEEAQIISQVLGAGAEGKFGPSGEMYFMFQINGEPVYNIHEALRALQTGGINGLKALLGIPGDSQGQGGRPETFRLEPDFDYKTNTFDPEDQQDTTTPGAINARKRVVRR